MAQCYYKLDNFNESIAIYEKLVSVSQEINFSDKDYYFFAKSLYKLQKYQKAITYYSDLINRFPDSNLVEESILDLCWCYIKFPERNIENEIDRVINEHPRLKELPEINLVLGYVYKQREEYKKALSWFEKVLAQRPDREISKETLWQTAECYYLLGDYNNAVKIYLQLNLLYNDSKEFLGKCYYQLGRCYEQLQNNEEARVVYQKIIDSSISDELTEKARNRIKVLSP